MQVKNAAAEVVATKATGSNGNVTFDNLPVYDANGNYVTRLYGSDLQIWPYEIKESDLPTGTATTSSITVDVNYKNKLYSVSIPGLTITPKKSALSLRTTTGGMLYSASVYLKKDFYPVGTTFTLADIDRVYALDSNNSPIGLTYADLANYTNTFSLEVASVNSRGETARKSTTSANRATITADDVWTSSGGDKYVYLRFYVDGYYTEFEVKSGESPVSVYSSSTYSSSYLLGMYEELGDALEDVNNINYQWGSTTSSTQPASRTLYIKLGQDDTLGRYDYMTPARDIEIDLNGHKLTMYSDTFRFLSSSDTKQVTVTNKAKNETARIVYTDLSNVDNLLIDQNEDIVYKYQSSSSATVIPGVYTITVDPVTNGTVTAKPAISTTNGTITVAHGNDVTFTVTPAKDYSIDTVKTKTGTSSAVTVSASTNSGYSLNTQTGVATYTMKDVRANVVFTAAFKANPKEEEKKDETKTEWTNPFTDVNTYASYYDAVKYVNQNGLMNGMTATSFGPNQTMTRAQFVTTLGRMYLGGIFQTTAEKDAAMINQYGTDSQFSDVSYSDASLSYAVPYIKWAESSGLVLGYGNGKFGPKDTITHQQMYIIMDRYAQTLANKSINVNSVTLRALDADKLGEGWLASARDGAIAAAKYGQQQGFLVNTTSIDPAGNALRYELAILLRQFSVNVLGWE